MDYRLKINQRNLDSPLERLTAGRINVAHEQRIVIRGRHGHCSRYRQWCVNDVHVLRGFIWTSGSIRLLPVGKTRSDECDRTEKKNDSGEAEERLVVLEHNYSLCDEVDS